LSEEPVEWKVGIRGNPHLMLVGLPGMGKTTTLISACRQLRKAGIIPIVFSYHQDIDEKLAGEFDDLAFADFDGLGFNPLRVEGPSSTAHIDTAGELRDIFAAIFRDLGDLQTEEIRAAIKQSYLDAGWSATSQPAAPPAFREFFRILQNKPKPDRGLMARLTELDDYGFFNTSGSTRSLLDVATPAVLRIHRTSNEVLQRAFASFVLYSVYKEMFKRGVQSRLTHAIIFDEAHRASRLKLLPTMAKECRKYGLSLVLASQEARDFDSSLFSAIASYLVFRVTEADAKAIARVTCASDVERRTIDRLKQLDRYNALFFAESQRRPAQVVLST
jgi:DNA phosphorothioation-dependent restriction protein DptH